ncbi:MAG: flavin reductase family protein [Phycisphaerales bacterium]|nr:flavin reductase family protein [Phycisphaerales bacterium]
MRHIDPAGLTPADRYKLLIGTIVPRPIALVSTVSPDGRANLAPFSFFNGVSSNPMSLLFCPSNTSAGAEKDTLRNAKPAAEGGVGCFVVNVAAERYISKAVGAAEELPYGESEFGVVGLTPAPSAIVPAPRAAESPVAFECETIQVVRLAPGQPGGGNVVIGRVVAVWADDQVVDARCRVNPDALGAVGRMAGFTYCTTRQRFEVPWGRGALENFGR